MKLIDKDKISTPILNLSSEAKKQLELIFDNQFDEQLCFRISVSSKGCDGFEFAAGLSKKEDNDFLIKINSITIIIDPFCAFYLKECFIDFLFDPETENEGFIVKPLEDKKLKGKFWKSNSELIPPIK